MKYRRRRIVIVGINYEPEETGIAPYTAAAAEHLAKSSDVEVITGVPHYPSWQVDAHFRRRFRTTSVESDVVVKRLRHYVPLRQSMLHRGAYETTFGAHALLALTTSGRGRLRPDAVIAVTPSLLGATSAAMWARRRNIPFGLWVQDLMADATVQTGIPGGAVAASGVFRLERWLFRQATTVAVASEAFSASAVARGVDSRRICLLPNWSRLGQPETNSSAVRDRLGWPRKATIVLHAGNMGLKQGLENVLATAELAAAREEPVLFVLMGDGNQRPRLEAMGGNLATLQIRDPVPADQLPDTLAAADVLLLNERSTVDAMSLPSKLTSYLGSGRPVVAAVREDGATAAAVRSSRAGVVAPPDNPARLLDLIRDLARTPALAAELGACGRQYAEENLSAAVSLSRLDAFVESLLA